MECKCKICRKNLGELANDMYKANSPIDLIVKRLQENNCETNANTVKRHLEKFEIYKETFEPVKVANLYEYDFNKVNFEKYNFDDNSPTEAVKYLQKIHLYLYFKQLEIVATEQDDYYKGLRETPPSQSISRLKQLYELLDNITGISIYANQQAALKKVELMGLSIEKFSAYVIPVDEDV